MSDNQKHDNGKSKTYSATIATSCYEWLIITTSLANTLIDIILMIEFYNNKQLSDFGKTLLSLQIFCHICYSVAFSQLYQYKMDNWKDWKSANKKAKCQFILFLLTLLILSPIINLLIYFTSAQRLFLTKKFDKIFESKWIHEDELTNDEYYVEPWHQIEAKRLFGYVYFEFFVANIPQFIFKLVIIDQVIQSTDYDYDSKVIFYVFLSFYLNLFVMTLKSYCVCGFMPNLEVYTLNQLFLAWSSIIADLSTFVYLFVWMYVYLILRSHHLLHRLEN